jgi:hypothetical protein
LSVTTMTTITTANSNVAPGSIPASPNSTGAIIGGVVGGLVALALLVVIAVVFMRRRNRNAPEPQGTALEVESARSVDEPETVSSAVTTNSSIYAKVDVGNPSAQVLAHVVYATAKVDAPNETP